MNASMYSGIKPTRRDYCQFIIATLTNHTQTYMAEHQPVFSHDAVNRYLMEDEVSPKAVWQSIGHLVRRSGNACLIFDDSVLDTQVQDEKFDLDCWSRCPARPARLSEVSKWVFW